MKKGVIITLFFFDLLHGVRKILSQIFLALLPEAAAKSGAAPLA